MMKKLSIQKISPYKPIEEFLSFSSIFRLKKEVCALESLLEGK